MRHPVLISIGLVLLLICSTVSSDEPDYNQPPVSSDSTNVEDYELPEETSNGSNHESSSTARPLTSSIAPSTTAVTTEATEEDYDEEEDGHDHQGPRSTSAPYEIEGESLSKLQKFLLTSVESLLREALPVVVRSGQETNVTGPCANAFLTLMSALRDSKIWAYRMLDASGKPPSGILEGTLTDFGSFEECLDVRSDGSTSEWKGHYCLLDLSAAFEKDPPLGLKEPPPGIERGDIVWDPALQIFWSMNRYGACIPSTCTREDLDTLANYFAGPAGMRVKVHSCKIEGPLDIDRVQITIIVIFLLIVLFVLTGTIVEYIRIVKFGQNEKHPKPGPLTCMLIGFSLHTNTKRLLATTGNPSGSPLRHLDGLRFFTLCWIILGHTYFFTDIVHYQHYRRVKQVRDVDDHAASMPLANFTLSVDTFFFISGLLLIFSNWKKLQLNNGKLNVVEFFIHRIWRIWPAYGATIALTIILPLLGSGPLWPQAVESAAATCRNTWWTNLAFVNNFLDSDKVCLFHTWFLSASMQFHIVGGLILYIMYRSSYAGIGLSIVLTIVSSVASFYFAYVNDVRVPSVIAYEVFADYEQKILKIYTAPYTHFGSYLAGIIVGYFMVKHKDVQVPKTMQALLWALSAAVTAAVIVGPHEAFKSNLPSILHSSLYYAFARTAWAWSIGWLVFACATGRGGPIASLLSWSALAPLSSLSYLAYLTHPLLMILHTGRIRERIYFGHYEMVSIFLSRLVMTLFLAYVVHVFVEVPFASIEKYIFPKSHSQKSSSHNSNGSKAKGSNSEHSHMGPVLNNNNQLIQCPRMGSKSSNCYVINHRRIETA